MSVLTLILSTSFFSFLAQWNFFCFFIFFCFLISILAYLYQLYSYWLREREVRGLKRQLDAEVCTRSLAERRVHTLEWIQNLGLFQQVEEEEDEDEGFSSTFWEFSHVFGPLKIQLKFDPCRKFRIFSTLEISLLRNKPHRSLEDTLNSNICKKHHDL